MVELRTESKKETKPFFKNMFSVCKKNVSLCYSGQCKHFRYIKVFYYNSKIDFLSNFEENFVSACFVCIGDTRLASNYKII